MIYWILILAVVGLLAGALGLGGAAGATTGFMPILLFIFVAFLVVSLLAGLFRRTG